MIPSSKCRPRNSAGRCLVKVSPYQIGPRCLQQSRRVAGRVLVAAKNTVFNELLSNADRLEVHAEDLRHRSLAIAQMSLASDPVDHRVDLQLVVALDGLKIGRPVVAARDNPLAVEVRTGGDDAW